MEVIEWDKKAERQKVYLMRNNKATSKGDHPAAKAEHCKSSPSLDL